ncbi:MAG: nucleotidyltransferase domain-containing protein [Pseudomonadales bacterium]
MILPATTQTLYAELLQQCTYPSPDGKGLSFVPKKQHNKTYLYLANSVGSRKTQHYLGEDTPKLQALITKERHLWESTKDDRERRAKLVQMLIAGGVQPLARLEGRVLQTLERGGIFLAGGVMVGTPAYRAYGPMLGVTWEDSTQTQDIDMAAWNKYAVALHGGSVDIKQLLNDAGMGIFELPTLNRKHPATKFKMSGTELVVDILTPDIGKPVKGPVYLEAFKTYATPLRFLDYLLEEIEPVVLMYGNGIMVNVPNPARFALHKLVISQRRPTAMAAKSRKDINQAEQVLAVLEDYRPGDIYNAVEAAHKMGEKFVTQMQVASRKLRNDLRQIINSVKPTVR